MLIAPFIIGLIFIVLTIASPIVFKFIFNVEKFNGFLTGLVCSLITCASLAVLIVVGIIVLNIVISNDVENEGIEILINSFDDITNLEELSFLTKFLAWGIIAILYIVLFLVLYFGIKTISHFEDESNMIFMFIGRYNLIPSIFWYIFCILLSFEINIFSNITDDIFDIFTNYFIILIEFGALFFLLLIAGSSIMIMLHHKDYNSLIIWICIATFFAPVIFYFLGFLTAKAFFFSFLNGACPLLSMVFGCFLYYKYASSPGNSDKTLGTKLEMS